MEALHSTPPLNFSSPLKHSKAMPPPFLFIKREVKSFSSLICKNPEVWSEEQVPLPLHFFPLFLQAKQSRGKQQEKGKAIKEAKKRYKEIWVKNQLSGKKERAYITLMAIDTKQYCFEMWTFDGIKIGQMEMKYFPRFIWIDYIRNFTKDLETSQALSRHFSFKDVGRHFISIALNYYEKGLDFIALKQGFSSRQFYKKLDFSSLAPRGAYALIKEALWGYDLRGLYFYFREPR